MTQIQRFVQEADQLTAEVQENGNRAKNICNRMEMHSRAAKVKTITNCASRASRIFLERIKERKNGNNGNNGKH